MKCYACQFERAIRIIFRIFRLACCDATLGIMRRAAMETVQMIHRSAILAAFAMLAEPTLAQRQQEQLPVSEIAPGLFVHVGRNGADEM